MEKNRIKKFTGIVLLSALIAEGIALYDSTIDHTSEICPITKMWNIVPNNIESEDGSIIPTGIYVHQIPEMKKDFAEKGGIREQMTAARLGYRNDQKARIAELEAENAQLRARIAELEAQKGGSL